MGEWDTAYSQVSTLEDGDDFLFRQASGNVLKRIAKADLAAALGTGDITPASIGAATAGDLATEVARAEAAEALLALPKMDQWRDDFTGTGLDPGKWQVINGTASVAGGRLVMPCTASFTTVQTLGEFDLTLSAMFAKLTPDQGGSGYECALYAGSSDGSTGYVFGYFNGNLAAATDTGYEYTFLDGAIAYDPVEHAWVRIRESDGTLYYDTSPDGSTWTNRFTSPQTHYDVRIVYGQLYSGYSSPGAADGTSYAEHFNVLPRAAPRSLAEPLASGESLFPRYVAGGYGFVPDSGTLYLTGWTAATSGTATNVQIRTGSNGASGLTYFAVGIYRVDDAGNITLIATTGDQHANADIASGSTIVDLPFSGGNFERVAGQRYALGVLFAGTTPPDLFSPNFWSGGWSFQLPWMSAVIAAAALPSSANYADMGSTGIAAAATVYP